MSTCLLCRGWRYGVGVVAALIASSAWIPSASAFSGKQHQQLALDACNQAALPQDFCRLVGVEAYNTDADEWDDPLAHAQMEPGKVACEEANRVQERLRALGIQFRSELDQLEATTKWYEREELAGKAARTLGRALHTLQDDHAHEGMNNPQHAWYSLQDLCTGSKTAPDSRADAYQEAVKTSSDVLASLALSQPQRELLSQNSCPVQNNGESSQPADRCTLTSMPWLSDACEFLADSKKWDGVDRRWNIAAVAPALIDAFVSGASVDLCMDPSLSITPNPAVDVSAGIPTCAKAHLLCFGKVDTRPPAATPEAQPESSGAEDSGCSLAISGRSGGASTAIAFAAAMAALILLRKRSSMRPGDRSGGLPGVDGSC